MSSVRKYIRMSDRSFSRAAVVIATASLMVAAGAESYAQITAKPGSVNSAAIQDDSILSVDVKDEALRGVDIDNSSVTGADVQDGSIGTRDVAGLTPADFAKASGSTTLDFDATLPNQCDTEYIFPGVPTTGTAVIATPEGLADFERHNTFTAAVVGPERINVTVCNKDVEYQDMPPRQINWMVLG